MVQNPPEGCQRIIPYLLYADAAAAIDFLCRAFGFEERFRIPAPDGQVMHAEIGFQDNIVMLANASADMGTASPRDLPARHCLICCYVDDVDAHHAHAKAAGAEIVSAPTDKSYGDRAYNARDPEGNDWYFLTHFKDVAPEDMQSLDE